MSQPNRIKIVFDGGTAEVYGDIFSDMLTSYANNLYDRQKQAQADAAKVDLSHDDRKEKFAHAAFNYDDAESRLVIVDKIEKVFRNRTGTAASYVQPGRELFNNVQVDRVLVARPPQLGRSEMGLFYVFGYAPPNARNLQNTVKVYAKDEVAALQKAKALAAKRAEKRGVSAPTEFTLHWAAPN